MLFRSNLKANNYHGVLSLNYYEEAVQKAFKTNKFDLVLIFSDDMSWVSSNFLTILPKNVKKILVHKSFNLLESETIKLMSLCNGIVLANSSFSWWAAYLGKNFYPRSIYAPSRWFRGEDKNLVLPDWVKIDTGSNFE